MAVMFAALAAACGARPIAAPAGTSDAGDVTLYRDRALVRQRVEVVLPAGGRATLRVRVAARVEPEDVVVIERDQFRVAEVRALDAPSPAGGDADARLAPTELELTLAGAPGRHVVRLGYATPLVTWTAAYTMTTTPARDRATTRGELAIRNATGVELRGVDVRLIDVALGGSPLRAVELLARRADPPIDAAPLTVPRELGRVDLPAGETRLELIAAPRPRPMRAVLVFDPIGTALDHQGAAPTRDPALGTRPPPDAPADAWTRVTESLEITRDPAVTAGLPAGPVRLLERRADGALHLLAEARLFELATRVAAVDTIALGPAAGVTGRRVRTELTIDDDRRRVTEELEITLANARPAPVEVVLREHLYRGQNWKLSYASLVAPPPVKEGPQQIAMRARVPARGQVKALYVVVYWWN